MSASASSPRHAPLYAACMPALVDTSAYPPKAWYKGEYSTLETTSRHKKPMKPMKPPGGVYRVAVFTAGGKAECHIVSCNWDFMLVVLHTIEGLRLYASAAHDIREPSSAAMSTEDSKSVRSRLLAAASAFKKARDVPRGTWEERYTAQIPWVARRHDATEIVPELIAAELVQAYYRGKPIPDLSKIAVPRMTCAHQFSIIAVKMKPFVDATDDADCDSVVQAPSDILVARVKFMQDQLSSSGVVAWQKHARSRAVYITIIGIEPTKQFYALSRWIQENALPGTLEERKELAASIKTCRHELEGLGVTVATKTTTRGTWTSTAKTHEADAFDINEYVNTFVDNNVNRTVLGAIHSHIS